MKPGSSRRAAGLLRAGLVFAGIGVAACGSPGAGATPEVTLARFAAALRDGRVEDAYRMMSERYRRRVSLVDFQRSVADDARQTSQTAQALTRPRGRALQEAVVEYGEGESVRLVREAGAWRVVTDIVNYYDQSTPRAALRTFVRAMERERYDVILRLIPVRDREGMTVERLRADLSGEGREEAERLVANLRTALHNPIEEVGDRATMTYAERFRVQFVREQGVWRIEDPD